MTVRVPLLYFAVASLLMLVSCGRQAEPVPPPSNAAELPPIMDVPDPSTFSFGIFLAGLVPREAERHHPEPFFRSVNVGVSGLSILPSDGAEPVLLFGDAGPSTSFDRTTWGIAVRGDLRYRIEEDQLIAEERFQGGQAAGDRLREIWRYRSGERLVAGPLAFNDVVIAATGKPSLICLDRDTGTLRSERNLPVLPIGPLFYLSGPGLLAALGADGSLSFYRMVSDNAPPADPVAALLQPTPEAFALIDSRMRERLGNREEKPAFFFYPYRPRTEIPSSGVALYKLAPPEAGRFRVYVDGAGTRPCLVEVFSGSGEPLASNLDYVGLESVVEQSFDAKETYFIAVAFLAESSPEPAPGEQLSDDSIPRLVVVEK